MLGYALSIHRLQGATCDKVILNAGPQEFASGLLLVGATRVKEFGSLSFDPFPNYARFLMSMSGKAFQKRKEEEVREATMEASTCVAFSDVCAKFRQQFPQQVQTICLVKQCKK